MADNKRRGRFGKGSEESGQSIFDLFEPPPEQEVSSFGRIPIIRDDEDEEESLDLTDVEFVESQAAAEAEAAGLQHWTEPATGQVPASLAADGDERASEVRGPSWRGDDQNWAGPDLADVFADTEAITHDRVEGRTFDEGRTPAEGRTFDEGRTPAEGRTFDEGRTPAEGRTFDEGRTPAEGPSFDRSFDEGRSFDEPTIEPRPPAPTGSAAARRVPEASSLFDLDDRPQVRGATDGPEPHVPAPTRERPPVAGRDLPPVASRAADLQPPPRRVVDLSEPMSPAQRAERERTENSRPSPDDRPPAPAPAPTGRLGSSSRPGPVVEPPAPSRGAHDAIPRRALAPEAPMPTENRETRPHVPPPDRGGAALHPQPEPRQRPVRHEPEPERSMFADDELPPIDDLEYDDPYEDFDEPTGRSLGQSFIVGIALAAVVFVSLGIGPLVTMGLVGVLTLLAVMELFNAMRIAGLRPATLLGLVGAVAVPAATYVRGEAGYPLVVGLAVVFGMLWYLTGADTERPVLNLGLTLTGILWVGGLAGFAALMLREDGGIGLLLATILITATSDTLAYIGGKAYGTKPFHDASPNKTWEGTVTGFFGALFAGLVLGVTEVIPMFENDFTAIMVLAVVVGVLAPIGDLAESLIKRDLGIKDMGTLLPGHGGVLDRVDGLLFALPGAYYVAVVYSLF